MLQSSHRHEYKGVRFGQLNDAISAEAATVPEISHVGEIDT